VVGAGSVGEEPVGAVGKEPVGEEAGGEEVVGEEAVGEEAVGEEAVGEDAVGLIAVGVIAVGEVVGVELGDILSVPVCVWFACASAIAALTCAPRDFVALTLFSTLVPLGVISGMGSRSKGVRGLGRVLSERLKGE
jgi:hypothetical protein